MLQAWVGLAGGIASAETAGPDGFGYTYIDSRESNGPEFNFTDISSTGTSLFDCDDCLLGAISMGFNFTFYGETHSDVYVSTNGFITFTGGQDDGCCSGDRIPSDFGPNDLVAGFWEDLNPSAGGSMHYQTLGTAPDRVFIVQFTDIPHYSDHDPVTFQYKLFEADDSIEVHYKDAPAGGEDDHTAGIENQDGTIGLEYFHGEVSLTNRTVRYQLAPAPAAPTVEGPSEVRVNETVSMNLTATDPEDRNLTYVVEWDDRTTERLPANGTVASGTTVQASHVFDEPGDYNVTVRAENTAGRSSNATHHVVDVASHPPDRPAPPRGPPVGTTHLDVEFTVNATDPDGNPVAIFVDWGDGAVQRVPTVGFLPSGQERDVTHRYDAAGTYDVRAWAVDHHGATGPTSDSSTIEVIL